MHSNFSAQQLIPFGMQRKSKLIGVTLSMTNKNVYLGKLVIITYIVVLGTTLLSFQFIKVMRKVAGNINYT